MWKPRKEKEKENQSTQLQEKKNLLQVKLTNKATGTSAEVTTGSNNDMRSKETVKVVVVSMLSKTKWGSGEYKAACTYTGEIQGYEEYDLTATVNGADTSIEFHEKAPTQPTEPVAEAEDDEPATTMLEDPSVEPEKEPSTVLEETSSGDVDEDTFDTSSNDLEDDTYPDDDEEDNPYSDDDYEEDDNYTSEQLAHAEERERLERLEREEAERQERQRVEQEEKKRKREAEAMAREAEARRVKLEKEIGITTTLKPRSQEEIATCFEGLNQRLLELQDEEVTYILPLKVNVECMSLRDYALLKRDTFGKDATIASKVDRYIQATEGFEGGIAELELDDPEQAALLLLSFDNLKHVMSNVRVLKAVFPDMDERMIRAMNPKNFGLKGKWDDPYEGNI